MSHGDAVKGAPGASPSPRLRPETPVAAFEVASVASTACSGTPVEPPSSVGRAETSSAKGAGIKPTWTARPIVDEQVEKIASRLAKRTRVICALSSGVDSSVAAALVTRLSATS